MTYFCKTSSALTTVILLLLFSIPVQSEDYQSVASDSGVAVPGDSGSRDGSMVVADATDQSESEEGDSEVATSAGLPTLEYVPIRYLDGGGNCLVTDTTDEVSSSDSECSICSDDYCDPDSDGETYQGYDTLEECQTYYCEDDCDSGGSASSSSDCGEIGDLASAIRTLLNLEPREVMVFGRNIVLDTDGETAERAKEIVAMEDVEPRHIMFEAFFIKLNTGDIKNRESKISTGTPFVGAATSTHMYQHIGKTRGHIVDASFLTGNVASGIASTILWTFQQRNNVFNLTAGFLLQENLARVVSKPVIRVKEGEEATFSNSIFFPVPNALVNENGSTVDGYVYKEVPIALTISNPRIVPANPAETVPGELERERIWAKISLSQGEIDDDNDKDGNPYIINTSIQNSVGFYRNGEPFIIATLVDEETVFTTSRVPVLHRVPILGKLFKNKSQTQNVTETVILLRPTIEENYSQENLVSRLKNHLNIEPLSTDRFDEMSNWSTPLFSGSPGKGSAEIYATKNCPELSFWGLRNRYTEREILLLASGFEPITARYGKFSKLGAEDLEQELAADAGLEEAVDGAINDFSSRTGLDKPSTGDLLIAAAHAGKLDNMQYRLFRERLGLPMNCE